MPRTYTVRAHFDEETHRWWADSDDVPGLVTEAATRAELDRNILDLAPDLLRANREHLPRPRHIRNPKIEIIEEARAYA